MACADGSRLTATMVLDATGHARKLVEFDAKFDPGYQVTTWASVPKAIYYIEIRGGQDYVQSILCR